MILTKPPGLATIGDKLRSASKTKNAMRMRQLFSMSAKGKLVEWSMKIIVGEQELITRELIIMIGLTMAFPSGWD